MGKQTKNFRQSKSSLNGNRGAQKYAQIQRNEPWHKRAWEYIKNKRGNV